MVVGRVRSRKVSMGFLRERVFSRDQPCETETSRETRVSHGLAGKVSQNSRETESRMVSWEKSRKFLARPRNMSQ